MLAEAHEIEGVCENTNTTDWLMRLNGHLVPCGMCGPRTGIETAADPPGHIRGCPSLCPACRDFIGPFPARSTPSPRIDEKIVSIFSTQLAPAADILRSDIPAGEMIERMRAHWVQCVQDVPMDALRDDAIAHLMDFNGIRRFKHLDREEQDRHAEPFCPFWSFFRLVIDTHVAKKK